MRIIELPRKIHALSLVVLSLCLTLSARGQMGGGADHGSVQLDLTYPTMRFFGSFSLYLDVQYFNGYGESLLGYNQRTDELRVGFALFR
jgi:outer membrane phospholipase A